MATAEENKAIIRRVIDDVNRRGDAAGDIQAPDYVYRGTGSFPGLSNVQRTITWLLAEGDMVTLHFTGRATHDSSGKAVTWEAIQIFRMADGKIAEHWGVMDRLGILRQLGLAPALPG